MIDTFILNQEDVFYNKITSKQISEKEVYFSSVIPYDEGIFFNDELKEEIIQTFKNPSLYTAEEWIEAERENSLQL